MTPGAAPHSTCSPSALLLLFGCLVFVPGGARVVVAAEERVCPGARAAQGVVLDHHRPRHQLELLAVGLQPLVGLGPDALAVVDLAEPVARAAAAAVALVLGAGALGADVGDVGQRAVAAVLAAEHR